MSSTTSVNKKIVTIGGGSGQFALLSGLRDLPGIDITAVVSMMDSGGSTGRLRDELGVLPPGDILKCVLALSRNREIYRELLQKRFSGENKLKGHSVGNMLLTMLSQYTDDFPESVRALGEILDSAGTVLIAKTRAKLIYVVNIMTKFGETDDFTARDFIMNLERFLKRSVDAAILNSARPDEKVLEEYRQQKARLVEIGRRDVWGNRKIIKKDLLNTSGDIARHDPKKLAGVIKKIIFD